MQQDNKHCGAKQDEREGDGWKGRVALCLMAAIGVSCFAQERSIRVCLIPAARCSCAHVDEPLAADRHAGGITLMVDQLMAAGLPGTSTSQ